MAIINCIAGLSLVSLALATPVHPHVRQYATPACAQVSAAVAAQPNVTTPRVPAQLAYDCITSVPLNKTAALSLIDNVKPYFKWQSTTTFLKNPPKEYVEKIQDPIDIWAGLADIEAKVSNSSYKNEYEFGFSLYRLLQRTHDGHFVFVPDVVGTIFNFARPVPLVSVSADGKALPKPFVYPDILASSFGNATFKPSAITTINGQNATKYLENWAQYGSLQDRDALYNNVFYQLASVSIGPNGASIGTFAGSGRGRWVYPGPTTELCFENGTTVTYENFARVLVPFKGVTDGESLYQKFFVTQPSETEAVSPMASNSTVATSTVAAPTTTPSVKPTPAPGYPPPVIREPHNQIGGYYLEGDYSDIAVLSIPSFVSLEEAEIPFQETGEKFLALARAAGKTKLIIDVSANGGGTILQGYDIYTQLFPKGIPHAAGDRFRAHESVDLIGQIFSDIAEDLPRVLVDPETNETLYDLESSVVDSVFNYQTDLDINSTNFESWADKYGPVPIHGDNFTNIMRWNLSDVLTPWNSGGIYIHGYGPLSNYTTSPFAAEDIIVMTDGYCASTCTIFSELMRQRAGVKFVAMGGRSRPGISQAVGGVKGTNDYGWDYIQALAQYTIENLSTESEGAKLNTTELGEYWSNIPFERMAPGTAMNVNFRDGYRDGADYDFPLQFLYEAADCRILYTAEMTYDVTAQWKAVADSAWGSVDRCIAGKLESGGYKKRETKRELSWEERALVKKMQAWKKTMSAEDYPMDLFTDMSNIQVSGRGFMFP